VEALKAGEEFEEELWCEDVLAKRIQILNEDFEFIKICKYGGEFMSEDKMNRLKRLNEEEENNWQLNGETMSLLTGNELFNLSVSRGTLAMRQNETLLINTYGVTISMFRNPSSGLNI
jgi:hypothetical protein